MSALSVTFAPPKHGSMLLAISAGEQTVRERFATRIHSFLEHLIGALRVLKDGFVEERIVLFLGAPECDLLMEAKVGSTVARLQVDLWPDSKRSKIARPKTLLSLSAAREEIALPFVDALRNLRATVSDADFLAGYRAPFPTRQYAAMRGVWK